MEFISWLLAETIIVLYQREQNGLFFAEGPAMEFNYQWPEGFSNFFVGTYQAKRPGYVSIGNHPTHIAIIKRSPLEHNASIDWGFLKNLISLLQKNNLKAAPYKEVGTSFDALFQKIKYEPEFPPETGFQSGENLPDKELGASNAFKLSPGMSASKETGSWAYIIEASSPQFYINKIFAILEEAAKPLIDNDLIDFYEIVDRHTNQRTKVVYSKKGKTEQEDWKTKSTKAASQLKYLAATLLSGAPTFKTALLRTIGTEDIKGGGKGWFGYDAQPRNFGLPTQELYDLNERSFSGDIVIKIFLDAMNNPTKIQQLEQVAQWAGKKKQESTGQKYPPYYLGGALEKLSWFWDKNDLLNDMQNPNSVLDHLSTLYDIIKYSEILQQVESEEFQYLKQQAKEAIEEALPNAEHLSQNDIISLNNLAGPLNLHPSIIHSLEQQNQKIKEDKIKRDKEQKESALKKSFLMPVDSYAYMILKDGKWQPIDQKFLKYMGQGDYEIDIGELAINVIGEEDTYEDAYYKAEEDAQSETQQKPSESYGNDKNEIDSDIDSYWDDFLNNIETEIDENTPEEEAVRIIKAKYIDDFIQWRKEEMQEQEEKESWKYEADTESQEFQQKVADYQKEIAEEMIWEQGLITLTRDTDKVIIQLHKKHYNAFKSILKYTINLNLRELDDDEEPYWKASTKISIDFIPEGGFTKPAYTLLQELIS